MQLAKRECVCVCMYVCVCVYMCEYECMCVHVRGQPSAASSGVCSLPMRAMSHTCMRRSRLHDPRMFELNGAQLT